MIAAPLRVTQMRVPCTQCAASLDVIDRVPMIRYDFLMSNDDFLPQRRSIRMAHYDYTQGGAYFITICIDRKQCVLGMIHNEQMICNKLGSIAERCWLAIPQHFPNATLDEFVIMPNHLHGILFLTDPLLPRVGAQHAAPAADKVRVVAGSVGAIVRSFKSEVTKQARQFELLPRESLWQRNYYEHVIRNEADLTEKREYIINNPLQWALDEYYVSS
jgi:putative transposase